MADQILEKFARTVVRYSLETRPGDLFVVRTTTLAIPLLAEVCREALRAGANVVPRISFDGQSEILYEEGSDEQLGWMSAAETLEAESVTARLTISAPYNTRSSTGIHPAKN